MSLVLNYQVFYALIIMATFYLTTTWKIPATIETCWFSIIDVKDWPNWWNYVYAVIEIRAGDSAGIGTIHKYEWTTCLPYHLTFELRTTQIDPFQLIRFTALGDLSGTGCCLFEQNDDHTRIQFQWNVQTNKPWMSLASILTRPVFEWNHRRVMQSGEQSLIQKLNSTP